jgi:hypothetical protein
MHLGQVREAVKTIYPNDTWASRVDRMPEDQVVAIYLRNLEDPPELKQKEQPPQQERLF